jgi:DNA invertase Pin-like site-specific DNA recombinase
MRVWLGYSRVSRVGDRGDRLVSPELQAERIESYAAQNGLTVEMLPAELDVSGGTTTRPILDKAIGRIERREASGLIVAQLDRLSRMDMADALTTLARIEQAGGEVIAVAENFDASTPEGEMGRNIMLSMNRMQLRRYRAQFEHSRRQAVARAIWPAAHVPLGYRKREDRTLEPDDRAADVVRAFRLRAQGRSWTALAQMLGVSPAGAQWIVANRVYLGEVRMKVAGEFIVAPNAHEPLVDRQTFEAAQLDHPRVSKRASTPALLAGLVRCAGCQRSMSPRANAYNCVPSNKRTRCPAPASISRKPVEDYVEGILLSHLAGRGATGREQGATLEAAEKALAEVEGELSAFQEATAAISDPSHFASGLQSRIAAVEEARVELGLARESFAAPEAGMWVDLWPSLDVSERRQVLRSAFDVVWVRSSGRRTVALAERVKVIERGAGPRNLSKAGRKADPIASVKWSRLPGEVGPALAENGD